MHAPLVSTTTELWSDYPLGLLRPVLYSPRLRLEILNLKTEVRHRLLGIRFICKEVSDESGAKQDTASCCREDYSRFWTFGSSSTSTGAGLSSIMMSVTSLPDCEG